MISITTSAYAQQKDCDKAATQVEGLYIMMSPVGGFSDYETARSFFFPLVTSDMSRAEGKEFTHKLATIVSTSNSEDEVYNRVKNWCENR